MFISEERQLSQGKAVEGRRRRRRFSAEAKRLILRAVEEARASGEPGAVARLLRENDLHSSHLAQWRKARAAGIQERLAGGTSSAPSNEQLLREREHLRQEITVLRDSADQAWALVELQGRSCRALAMVAALGREVQATCKAAVRAALEVLVPVVGIAAACSALGIGRATYYRTLFPRAKRRA